MKKIYSYIVYAAALLLLLPAKMMAQCPINVAPTYPSSCTSQFFTSITAGGTGVVSTISYSATGCIGIYFNNFATQGITAPTGSTINFTLGHGTGYFAWAAVYVDWNDNGMYETTELAGTITGIAAATPSIVYSFTIPLTGITTNTNLHMRVFLGEPPASGGPISSINPPCSAKWGESVDYYLKASCTVPTISVSPATPSVCGPTNSIALTASGAGPTPTYSWTPTATLSSGTGTTVTATPGITRTYSVTGYGPGVCPATGTVTVTVNPAVVPVITPGGPTSFCPGGSVAFTETSGSGTVYQWYNGSTAIPGATNSTYTAAPAATTTYSVQVTTATGCTGTTTATATILPVPAATITPGGPTTVCAPGAVTLNATTGTGYTYQWYNAGGAITGATAAAYPATVTGGYSVAVTNANGCKDTSATTTVTINPPPVATATASGPMTFCAYSSVTLTAGTGAGYTYQWLDGTTPIAGATNVSYTATIVGTHDYRIKVTNAAGCSDTTDAGDFPVVINPAPVSTISASGPLSFCTGGNVTLSVPFVTGYTYQWYYGTTVAAATPISGATAPTYTTATTGYYYVRVTTPAGCTTNSAATAALVTSVTLPTIVYNTPLRICWGSHVALSLGIGAGASGITYQWIRNGAPIPGATGNSYNASMDGSYTCVVNVAGSCVGTPPAVSVAVMPLPNPIITYSGGYLKTGSFYSSYQWYRSLILMGTATSYKIMPTTPADYSVIVTDTNGCVSEATNYTLRTVLLGVEEATGAKRPGIYPNPSTGMVYIQYPEPVQISISSMDGRMMLQQPSTTQIDISALATGVYIITLQDKEGNRICAEKLIKQ